MEGFEKNTDSSNSVFASVKSHLKGVDKNGF